MIKTQSAPPAPAKPAPSPKVAPAPKPKPAPPAACGVELSDSAEALAEQYYIKAERAFSNDDIQRAKKGLETAVCLNPRHKQAQELLQLLKQTYPEN